MLAAPVVVPALLTNSPSALMPRNPNVPRWRSPILEPWSHDAAGLAAVLASLEYLEKIRPDEQKLLDFYNREFPRLETIRTRPVRNPV